MLAFWPRQLLTALVIAGLAAVNVRGTRLGGGLQFVITCVKVGVAPVHHRAAVRGATRRSSEPTYPPKVEHLSPGVAGRLVGVNWALFGAALVGVLWAYHGWMNIAPVAEEVKDPQRNIPLALLGGVLLLIVLYCGANVAYYLVIPRDQMAELKDTTVATEFCLRLLGPGRGGDRVGDRDDVGVRGAQRQPARRPAAALRDGQGPARPGRRSRAAPAVPDAGPGHAVLAGLVVPAGARRRRADPVPTAGDPARVRGHSTSTCRQGSRRST